ncbi:MAG TPA: macro domain-containing protein [Polyangiaceae bacterium]|jgi:O-acetyl-ADP-ribose deacetylase (regulator of RNase III)|nr:macro domain-containing protein [Polyangiaceae bacterium]
MPTRFIKGDILDATDTRVGKRAVVFGADCAGRMDAGIAVAIARHWPAFAEAFSEHCTTTRMQLGDVFSFKQGEVVVYAVGIQRDGGKPKLAALERGLAKMALLAEADEVSVVLLPRIGSGKNGLDWDRVKRILSAIGKNAPMELLVYEQFVRTPASATD